jgi:hypothetical protein
MLVDTNSPKLARADINDMFADMGYGTSGNVSPITTTGEAGKLFRFSAIANTILHFLRIRRSSTTALDVQNDSSTSVFNVDTTNEVITGTAITTSGEASKLIKTDSAGDVMLSRTKGLYFGNKSTINLGAGIYGIIGAINTQGLSTVPHMIFGTTGNDDKGYISFVNNGAERFNINYDGTIKVNSLAGTGNRMVVADSSGNLSAIYKNIDFLPFDSITTTWTNIYLIDFACFLSITFYNLASTSMQGIMLVTVTPTGMLTVSSTDNTGLGVSVQYNAGYIQLKTTSGTVSGSVNRLG